MKYVKFYEGIRSEEEIKESYLATTNRIWNSATEISGIRAIQLLLLLRKPNWKVLKLPQINTHMMHHQQGCKQQLYQGG